MGLAPQSAVVSTATVEVKTLTLNGKQMTLSVFRQLPYRGLFSSEGYLLGTPWGHVNYHPDRCRDWDRHLHLVWQSDNGLFRCRMRPADPSVRRSFNDWSNPVAVQEEDDRHRRHLEIRKELFSSLPQLFIAV